MRLYAYRDRKGWERWGVIVDGQLLTGRQLEQLGRIKVPTWTGIAWRIWRAAGLPKDIFRAVPPRDWIGDVRRATDRALRKGAKTIPLSDRKPLPAIVPSKVICVGLNYLDHVEEQAIEPPDRPLIFAKFPASVIADGEPIVKPTGTHALDLEAELGVVIGRRASRVKATDAMSHVAGYVVGNDVTARDWQGVKPALEPGERGDGQWLRAKGSDTFYPIGPVFVTADEFDGPPDLPIRSWRIPGSGPDAGKSIPMQDGRTGNTVFDIPTLIEYISATITLEPGDVISTGTPAGVGAFRDPPVFLQSGDRVRIEIEGIGSVENPVVDAAEID
jgi:2-keto-4-pentenoate hydratase/2-oxohepta-3-ene-1,7-dioic acid hydratase in catechol pathway